MLPPQNLIFILIFFSEKQSLVKVRKIHKVCGLYHKSLGNSLNWNLPVEKWPRFPMLNTVKVTHPDTITRQFLTSGALVIMRCKNSYLFYHEITFGSCKLRAWNQNKHIKYLFWNQTGVLVNKTCLEYYYDGQDSFAGLRDKLSSQIYKSTMETCLYWVFK